MTDVRIIVTVKNARVLQAMERLGYGTIVDLCRAAGPQATQGEVGALVNFKKPAVNKYGAWRPVALAVADALGMEPHDLWPDETASLVMEKNRAHFDIGLDHAISIAGDENAFNAIFAEQLLARLPPRQRQIIERRFGFAGPAQTLEEVAADLGVTGARIRQIEEKAIRRLRGVAR